MYRIDLLYNNDIYTHENYFLTIILLCIRIKNDKLITT